MIALDNIRDILICALGDSVETK